MTLLPILPTLAKLPYPMDALAPYISGESICFTQQKILTGHVDTLATLLKQYKKQQPESLECVSLPLYLSQMTDTQLVRADDDARLIHRYASEIYNHAFYFASMRHGGGGHPLKALHHQLLQDFGSFEKFAHELIKAATCPDSLDKHWLWLVVTQKNKLTIVSDSCAHPLAQNLKPLAVINLWQHAYYLDYRERKGDYIQALLDHLIHWQHIESALHDPKMWHWT